MSRFFNKDMNIQNYAQTKARAVSRHRLSHSAKDKPIYLNWVLLFIGHEIQLLFKKD